MKANFREYLQELESIYKDADKEYQALITDLSDKQMKADKGRKDQALAPERKAVLELDLKDARTNFSKQVEMIRADINKKYQELRADYIEKCEEYLTLKPESVTAETIAIINSGLMNTSDYQQMCDRNWNNPTVLRLISGKLRASEDVNERHIAVSIDAYCSIPNRTNILDSANNVLSKSIDADCNSASKSNTAFKQLYEDNKTSLYGAMNSYDGYKGEIYV